MLKKQTVWLLTMLSLMIVLSVYYMTSPKSGDLAYVDSGKDKSQEATSESKNDIDVKVDGETNYSKDELFTTIRMDLQDQRSMKKSKLNEIVASSTASADEKNEALNDINKIDDVSTKESILEDSILASAQYQDVLVRNDGDKVHVHIKVDQLSKKEVVDIMQMVRDEFGEVEVNVKFE